MKSSVDLKPKTAKPCISCPGTPTSIQQHSATSRPPQRSPPTSSLTRGTRSTGQPTRVDGTTAATGCYPSPRVSSTSQYSEGRSIGKVGSRMTTPAPVGFEGTGRAMMSADGLRGSGSASRVAASPVNSARRVSTQNRHDVKATR